MGTGAAVQILTKLRNAWGDRRLGISSRGTATTEKPGGVFYASVAYDQTRDVLRRLDLRPDDVFIDIGSGKGRVVALAAQQPVRSVIGIEYEPALVAIAEENVRRLKSAKAPIQIVQGAAESFDYQDVSAAYCFNAIEADILDHILAKIEADRAPRPFRIAFVEESPAQALVFERHRWLALSERFVDRGGHDCAIYSSIGAERGGRRSTV
jgi:SAM-dependent methyltransferase